MIKLTFTPRQIENPASAFNYLARRVTTSTKQNEKIDLQSFYSMLANIGDSFVKKSQKEVMNKNSKRLAEQLVSLGNETLAGIIYSFLIKLNIKNAKIVEQLAYNALAIAKRFNDPVHIMARCENLNKILLHKNPKDKQRLKILFEEKRALTNICKNYNNMEPRYKTISRKLKPLNVYENMLCNTKIQIAKFLQDSNKTQCLLELNEAMKIAVKLNKSGKIKEIERIKNSFK